MAANTSAVVKRKEESLIEEMRAAMARDRENSAGRGSPVAQGSASAPEPSEPPRRRGLARLLKRDG